MTAPGFDAEASLHEAACQYGGRPGDEPPPGAVRPTQSYQWCGDKYRGQVASCPAGQTCKARRYRVCEGWWIFRTCFWMQTVDKYCQ